MDKLPPLCKSTDICGYITEEVARETGLRAGMPVAGGMFDIDACAIAVNAAREDRICVIAGTWSINEYIRKQPVDDKSVAMNSVFCDPDYYLIEESSATSAGNNEWFIRTLLPEFRDAARAGGKSVYDACSEMVETIPIDEMCPVFLPFLFASNVHPNAKSCFVGMTGYHSRAHLVRSVYEGITFCHKYHIDKLLKSRTNPALGIQLAGGVARSGVWSQMFADVTQLPVETVDVNETGALGCAIAAAVATAEYPSLSEAARKMVRVKATFTPNPEAFKSYSAKYALYLKIITALDSIWNDMQEQS
jgi:L-xylulokinase